MKASKRIISAVLVVVMMLGIIPFSSMTVFATNESEDAFSGQCGENAFWEFNANTGDLIISGIGEMYDYHDWQNGDDYAPTPWKEHKYEIKRVTIVDGITSIGDHSFMNCSNLITVTIPETVLRLGLYSFANCRALPSVDIPSSVKSLEGYCFENCTRLSSITLHEGLETIRGDGVFSHTAISSIYIPSTVTDLGDYNPNYMDEGGRYWNVFDFCPKLINIEVGKDNSVYTIKNGLLYNSRDDVLLACPKNKTGSIVVPENTKWIAGSCFLDCSRVSEILLPTTVSHIGQSAFEGCSSLSYLTVPEGTLFLGRYAFAECSNIRKISLPSTLSSFDVDYGMFSACYKLKDISVHPDNAWFESYNGLLYNKGLTTLYDCVPGKTGSLSLPDSLEMIAGDAFYDCDSLTSITIPNSVTSIGYSAFAYCNNLTSIIIPNSVTSIGNRAFYSCPYLTIYGYSGSTAEEYALKANYNFVDISDSTAKYKENDLKLYYSVNKNNIELRKVVNVGADYLRGNSFGMLYDGEMRWEVSNTDVLQIQSYSSKAALMYFKAVGLGTCDITLYLDGEIAVTDTVTVKVTDKALLENNSEYVYNSSAFSTLETARNTCKQIIDGCNGTHRALAAFFNSVENGLGVGVITKEALAAAGFTTSMSEDAEDKAVEKIMMELIGSEDMVGSATKKIEKAYKVIKAGYSTATVNKERFFDTIVNVFDYSYEQVEEFYNKVDDYKSKTDMAFDVLDVTLSALLISQFEMDTIKDMRDATSYGSSLYLSLDRLYNKRANLVSYATERFLKEQVIDQLDDLIGKLGGPTYKVAKTIGFWAKLAYDSLGGLDAEDYLVAQNNWAFAGYLYNYSLKVNGTVENFERYYKYYVAAVKAALISAVNISRDYKLTNIADGLYEQINLTCNYDNYLDQVRNDLNNVSLVSKENLGNDKVFACYGGGIASYSLYDTAYIGNDNTTTESFYNDIEEEKTISIPAYIEGSKIVGISDYGFAGLTDIQGFMLPKTIETIGEYAFSNCNNAKYIYLNSGITEIGEGAFWNCTQLEFISLPESLKTVGSNTFSGCESLENITFGKNVEAVNSKALENCTGIKTAYFNNPSTIIAPDIFEGCGTITVYGYEGSTAQTFAENCGYNFVALDVMVSKMRIVTPATLQQIISGDTVSTDGLTVEVTYMDNTSEIIDSGWSVVCDTTAAGEQLVHICFKDSSISYPITVIKRSIENITLSYSELNLFITDSYQLIADCITNNMLNALIWNSDNTEVATVNETGYVTAVGVGSANVTVSSADGSVSDTCKVTVVNNQSLTAIDGQAQSQFFSPTKSGYYTFYTTGSTAEITAILYNSNGEIIGAGYGQNTKIISWLVDDEAYYVKIYTTDGNKLSLTVSESVEADSVKIISDELSGKIGAEYKLQAVFEPLNSIDENLTWTSSDEEIVSVDQFGNIKLLKEGTATITVTTENGLSDSIEVTVIGYPIITVDTEKSVELAQNNPHAYFSFTPDEDGYYVFYSYNSDYDTYGYILDTEMNELKHDDDGGEGSNFKVGCMLQAGVTYILKARFYNESNSGNLSVKVEKTKYVTEIDIISMPNKTEYVKGFARDRIDFSGLILKFTWSDGSTTDWSYGNGWIVEGESIYRDLSNVDETGEVIISCGEGSATLNFTLIDNPVDHLELVSGTSRYYVENYNGYTNSDGNFIYNTYYPNDAVIKIVYTDATSVTSKVGDYVENYYISWNSNQSNTPWVVGKDNISTISYLGHTVNLPITVVANTVESIEITTGTSAIFIENAYGSWNSRWNPETDEYDSYFSYSVGDSDLQDAVVQINYSDGSTKTAGIGETVDGYSINWHSNQYDHPWTLGDDNFLTVSYLGKETQLSVSVVPNPVDHIEITSAPTREYIYGDNSYGATYDDGTYSFSPTDLTGLVLTVYYTDGSNKQFHPESGENMGAFDGYRYWISYNGYDPEIGDFPVTFNYMGKTADYTVVLKEVTTLLGDADGDGAISVKDLKLLKKYLLGTVDDSGLVINAADVDGDGEITTKDMRELKKYLLGTLEFFTAETMKAE